MGVGLAEEINQGDDDKYQGDERWHKTAPDEAVDHVFGFYVKRAARTAPRCLLKHVAAVSTGSCAHLPDDLLLYWSKKFTLV